MTDHELERFERVKANFLRELETQHAKDAMFTLDNVAAAMAAVTITFEDMAKDKIMEKYRAI